MKFSNERIIKDILNELISGYSLQDGLLTSRLSNSWGKVVGELIARHTVKVWVKNKTLYLQVDSASLKSELSYSKEKIIRSANQFLGDDCITEIVFN